MVSVSSVINLLAYCVALVGYLPLVAYLDPVATLAFPVALAGGVLFDRRRRYPLAGFPSSILTVVSFLAYAVQWSRDNPAAPVVNLLVVLLAVRLVTVKTPRNVLQIFALALFALAGSSLFNLSAVFIVYLLILLALIAVSLVLMTFHAVDDRLTLSGSAVRKVVLIALLMPIAAIPLILCFFAILPRTQYPLWNVFPVPTARSTGFTDRLEPGKSATVAEVATVAFRAECVPLGRDDLYWRGIVLNVPVGSTWVREPAPVGELPLPGRGKTVDQIVYPEPSPNRYLFALDLPQRISGLPNDRSGDLVFLRKGRGEARARYEARSVLSDTVAIAGRIDRPFYLRLPKEVSPRTRKLAHDLARNARTDQTKLERILDFFGRQRYRYATTDLPVGVDPIDLFLFEKRRGHCELFASSCGLLLRLAGVPARLVGGYYGGEYHDMGGYYVVTEAMAHVWVEAFIEGRGWVRVDPSSYAVNFRQQAGAAAGSGIGLLARLSDSLTYYWNRAVLTYDLQKQLDLVRTANRRMRRIHLTIAVDRLLLPLGMLFAVVAGGVFLGSRLRSRRERLVSRFYAQVEREYGLSGAAGVLGLQELADMTGDPAVAEFATRYGGILYRDRPFTAAEYRQLALLLRRIGKSGNR